MHIGFELLYSGFVSCNFQAIYKQKRNKKKKKKKKNNKKTAVYLSDGRVEFFAMYKKWECWIWGWPDMTRRNIRAAHIRMPIVECLANHSIGKILYYTV